MPGCHDHADAGFNRGRNREEAYFEIVRSSKWPDASTRP